MKQKKHLKNQVKNEQDIHVNFSCARFLMYCCRKFQNCITYANRERSRLYLNGHYVLLLLVFSVLFRTGMKFEDTSFSVL